MELINIYAKDISLEDKNFIYMAFGHAGITQGMIKFCDLNSMQPQSKSISFCFGGAHNDIARAIVNSGKLSIRDFLSADVFSDAFNLIFISIPVSIKESSVTRDNKAYLWNKILLLAQKMKEYGYWNVEGSNRENVNGVPAEQSTAPEDSHYDTSTEEAINISNAEASSVAQDSVQSSKERAAELNVDELLNGVISGIAASDSAIGKSLSSYSRVSFTTKDGLPVNIYPTNRISSDDDGVKMSFKDVIVLLKMAILAETQTITFHNGE